MPGPRGPAQGEVRSQTLQFGKFAALVRIPRDFLVLLAIAGVSQLGVLLLLRGYLLIWLGAGAVQGCHNDRILLAFTQRGQGTLNVL